MCRCVYRHPNCRLILLPLLVVAADICAFSPSDAWICLIVAAAVMVAPVIGNPGQTAWIRLACDVVTVAPTLSALGPTDVATFGLGQDHRPRLD